MLLPGVLLLSAAAWAVPLGNLRVPRPGWSRLFWSAGFFLAAHIAAPDIFSYYTLPIGRVSASNAGNQGTEPAPSSQGAYSRAALQALSPFLLWNALSSIETRARRIEMKWADERRYVLSNLEMRAKSKGMKVEDLDEPLRRKWTKDIESRYRKQAPLRLKEAAALRRELECKRAELDALQAGTKEHGRFPGREVRTQALPSASPGVQTGSATTSSGTEPEPVGQDRSADPPSAAPFAEDERGLSGMPEEQNALEVHLQNLRRRLMVAKTRQKSVQKYLAADLTAGASADGQASVPVGTDSGPVQASLQASEAKIARLKKAIEDAEGKLREVKAAETQAAVAAPAIGEASPSTVGTGAAHVSRSRIPSDVGISTAATAEHSSATSKSGPGTLVSQVTGYAPVSEQARKVPAPVVPRSHSSAFGSEDQHGHPVTDVSAFPPASVQQPLGVGPLERAPSCVHLVSSPGTSQSGPIRLAVAVEGHPVSSAIAGIEVTAASQRHVAHGDTGLVHRESSLPASEAVARTTIGQRLPAPGLPSSPSPHEWPSSSLPEPVELPSLLTLRPLAEQLPQMSTPGELPTHTAEVTFEDRSFPQAGVLLREGAVDAGREMDSRVPSDLAGADSQAHYSPLFPEFHQQHLLLFLPQAYNQAAELEFSVHQRSKQPSASGNLSTGFSSSVPSSTSDDSVSASSRSPEVLSTIHAARFPSSAEPPTVQSTAQSKLTEHLPQPDHSLTGSLFRRHGGAYHAGDEGDEVSSYSAPVATTSSAVTAHRSSQYTGDVTGRLLGSVAAPGSCPCPVSPGAGSHAGTIPQHAADVAISPSSSGPFDTSTSFRGPTSGAPTGRGTSLVGSMDAGSRRSVSLSNWSTLEDAWSSNSGSGASPSSAWGGQVSQSGANVPRHEWPSVSDVEGGGLGAASFSQSSETLLGLGTSGGVTEGGHAAESSWPGQSGDEAVLSLLVGDSSHSRGGSPGTPARPEPELDWDFILSAFSPAGSFISSGTGAEGEATLKSSGSRSPVLSGGLENSHTLTTLLVPQSPDGMQEEHNDNSHARKSSSPGDAQTPHDSVYGSPASPTQPPSAWPAISPTLLPDSDAPSSVDSAPSIDILEAQIFTDASVTSPGQGWQLEDSERESSSGSGSNGGRSGGSKLVEQSSEDSSGLPLSEGEKASPQGDSTDAAPEVSRPVSTARGRGVQGKRLWPLGLGEGVDGPRPRKRRPGSRLGLPRPKKKKRLSGKAGASTVSGLAAGSAAGQAALLTAAGPAASSPSSRATTVSPSTAKPEAAGQPASSRERQGGYRQDSGGESSPGGSKDRSRPSSRTSRQRVSVAPVARRGRQSRGRLRSAAVGSPSDGAHSPGGHQVEGLSVDPLLSSRESSSSLRERIVSSVRHEPSPSPWSLTSLAAPQLFRDSHSLVLHSPSRIPPSSPAREGLPPAALRRGALRTAVGTSVRGTRRPSGTASSRFRASKASRRIDKA